VHWGDEVASNSHRSKDYSDLEEKGATAISICSPVNPAGELGTGFSELYREGLPSLPGIRTWKRRTEIVKGAADEFLNAAFGWLPLVSEVKDTANNISHSAAILKQYHDGAGSNVHREFSFPVEESESSSVVAENVRAQVGTGFSGTGKQPERGGDVIRTEKRRVSQWFSGSFTYAVPSQTDSWRRALGYGSSAGQVLGIQLTPEVLWNLTPWSWAVDWFSNAGDVINNISNFAGAGQVMRYGYMMEERSTTITYSMTRSGVSIDGNELGAPSTTISNTSKVRQPANPYGFGLTFDGLSPLQVAIATALGITRL
jgi:hypothetical protein